MSLGTQELATLSRLLDEALELPVEHQAVWMDSLPGDCQPLRPLLRHLLAHGHGGGEDDRLSRLPQWAAQLTEQRLGAARAPHAGDCVGPYRLIEQIGCGGMGTVWLAESAGATGTGPVALKLPVAGARHHRLAERFERECAILATLKHRHIACLHDAGIAANGQHYLALAHVAGVPITEHCDRARLTVRARVALFLQVLQAVRYAHAQGVVHGDLKPANIFVTHEGQVQLLDFGAAAVLAEDGSSAAPSPEFGAPALTPDYASPEQLAGAPIAPASDIYSLGVVFYELLTGQRPYRLVHDTRAALLQSLHGTDLVAPSRCVRTQEPASLRGTTRRQLQRELQGALDTLAMVSLHKDPCQRHASVECFERELQRWLAGKPGQARMKGLVRRLRRFWRRQRRAFIAGLAAATVRRRAPVWPDALAAPGTGHEAATLSGFAPFHRTRARRPSSCTRNSTPTQR